MKQLPSIISTDPRDNSPEAAELDEGADPSEASEWRDFVVDPAQVREAARLGMDRLRTAPPSRTRSSAGISRSSSARERIATRTCSEARTTAPPEM